MALPRAESVVELYSKHPEVWVKGYTFADGKEHIVPHDEATMCCLIGAIIHVHGPGSKEMKRAEGCLPHHQFSLTDVNDNPMTTIDDVIRFAEKARV